MDDALTDDDAAVAAEAIAAIEREDALIRANQQVPRATKPTPFFRAAEQLEAAVVLKYIKAIQRASDLSDPQKSLNLQTIASHCDLLPPDVLVSIPAEPPLVLSSMLR